MLPWFLNVMDNKNFVGKKKKNPIPTTLDFNKKCRDKVTYGPPQLAKDHAEAEVSIGEGVMEYTKLLIVKKEIH
jgi:hypothetical protein